MNPLIFSDYNNNLYIIIEEVNIVNGLRVTSKTLKPLGKEKVEAITMLIKREKEQRKMGA